GTRPLSLHDALPIYHRAEARTVAVGAVLPPARHAREDQTRVLGRERVPAEPPLLERARDEVLDEDVGVPDQTLEQRLAARVGEVERDRAFASRVDLPPELTALPEPGA